jgi:FKBP-type peptidyl-prolyl cis-trans isomerase
MNSRVIISNIMKIRLIYGAWIVLFSIALLIQGCDRGNDDQELIEQEQRLLEQYLEENNITQEPTSTGLYYIPITEGTGTQAEFEYIVDINYAAELLDGTILFTSYEDLAIEHNLFNPLTLYGPIRTLAGWTGIPGLDEGLTYMKEGGKAMLIMPSSINGYGGSSYGRSPAYSTHIYTIELIHAFNDPEKFEQEQIAEYLDSNDVDSAKLTVTETGLHFIEIGAGTGDLINADDDVDLWYTGRFIDGRVFKSNIGSSPLMVPIPAVPYFIPAWDEALRMMKEGGKARIIVPYELGFGESGSQEERVPPYMTLVYDLHVEKVTTY